MQYCNRIFRLLAVIPVLQRTHAITMIFSNIILVVYYTRFLTLPLFVNINLVINLYIYISVHNYLFLMFFVVYVPS